MLFKALASIFATILFLLFVGPVIVKLKEFSIIGVTLIGITLMVIDLWQSVRSKED